MTDKLLIRYSYNIAANDFIAAGKGSSSIKNTLKSMGIDASTIRRIAIISYEAEINLVIHSYGGMLHCDLYENKIDIITEDKGPGIENIDLALTEGYSTATESVRELGFGAGMGLPNMKKYSDDFDIASSREGTFIKITVLLQEV
ncbi:anti-sigma regulatory factor [Sedimentibacter hydroxybenzoicus DSM 7310]|uniref:Anti-sigma regulatory factor n=1 Tax=Sedimentibacter hydroxybenzoicus DSM 7310 TaxID=1123245 RepID=A0A974GW39_SEDHY|nr:ATP-binding protein [Sedimentibacter hydroxybenzoicus]NYB74064.1 anti-sigma regulatory factor [Sedimentibacter hydroxybenzoicus DSM 7310]